jgi:hypothetical protein
MTKEKWCVMFEYEFRRPARFVSRHHTKKQASIAAAAAAPLLFENEIKKKISSSYSYKVYVIKETK